MKTNLSGPLLLGLGAYLICPPPSAGCAEPATSAGLFFQPDSLQAPQLSPDGKRLLLRKPLDDDHRALAMIDLETRKVRTIVKNQKLDVADAWWKSDELLLVLCKIDERGGAFRAVNLTTGETNPLDKLNFHQSDFINILPDDPECVLMRVTSTGGTVGKLQKVNLKTGAVTNAEILPDEMEYFYPNAHGTLLAGAFFSDRHEYLLYWRTSPAAAWSNTASPTNKLLERIALAVESDGKHLLVYDRTTPMESVWSMDLTTGSRQPVFSSDETDFDGLSTWGGARRSGWDPLHDRPLAISRPPS